MKAPLNSKSAASATDAIAQSAHDAAESIKRSANKTGEDAKTAAADHIQSAADATEAARDALHPDLPVDPIMDKAVRALSQAAQQLHQTDISTLARDAGEFAKRNPALVLGGAALVGFAAARFLKVGPAETQVGQSDDPWTDHGSTG